MKTKKHFTVTGAPKPKLYIKKLPSYDAVKLDCALRWNLGALEKRNDGGILNAGKKLIKLIAQAGGNFVAEPGFVPAQNGRMRRGAGTGYVGWKNFASRAAAIRYLEQYFVILGCAEDDTTGATSPKKKPSQAPSGKRERASLVSLGSGSNSSAGHGRPRSDLERMGFQNLGQWKINAVNPAKLEDVGDDRAEWEALIAVKFALYAFCHGDEILYIGKTARSIDKRFVGYRDPGKTQATNWKCHNGIRELLNRDETVRILVFPDNSCLQWDNFRINLAAGLEDALVAHFDPVLNGKKGKKGKPTTTTEDDEQWAEEADLRARKAKKS